MDEKKRSSLGSQKQELSNSMLLLFSVFVVATCGLVYELVAGTAASYLLGDSVTQFSTIIGVYLFSMGIGSFLSKYFSNHLLSWFVQIEILVGLVGGFSSTLLFLLFGHVESFRFVLYFLVGLTGTLVGLEIPLLMRILQNKFEFKDLVSKVFTFDYIGALLASVIFPLVLVPYLGLLKTSFLFGILNVLVAFVVCNRFQHELAWFFFLRLASLSSLFILLLGFVYSDRILNWSETMAFQEKIVYAESSPYQRIVLTKQNDDLRLYLNGNLQFASSDEYRYHEALVHPALQSIAHRNHILILGGGDGMAVREVLKYTDSKSITLVDLDKKMTDLFTHNLMLSELNQHSFSNPKVKVINEDAFLWLKNSQQQFDCIIVDFPDPSNYSVGKLYSLTFYQLLRSHLHDSGVAVVQSTSPYVAPKSFWCINQTLLHAGLNPIPYHTYLPSFGDWGYHLATKGKAFHFPDTFITSLRYLNTETFKQMLVFPKDMPKVEAGVNKLNNQILVHYFEKEWANIQ